MEWISLALSGLALIISMVVACLHYRRDRRESEKFKSENEIAKKKVKFLISEINYSLERGLEETGKYYEHHLVRFDVSILNIGNPPIYLDKIGVIFIKPLVGGRIGDFTFSVSHPSNKIEKGKKYMFPFAKAFESEKSAYEVIESQIEVKCLDIEGEVFPSGLLNPKFGDSI